MQEEYDIKKLNPRKNPYNQKHEKTMFGCFIDNSMVAKKRFSSEEAIELMKVYICDFEELKKSNPERAREISKRELKKIGVLDENGNPKENIVTGGHVPYIKK